MPVFRSGVDQAPTWSTLEFFEIVEIKPGQSCVLDRVGLREKLIVLTGACSVAAEGELQSAAAGFKGALERTSGQFAVENVTQPTTLLRVCGRWGADCTTFGTFTPAGRVPPRNEGDPFDYPKTNGMDRHYHDCDEYWIVWRGRGQAVSEGRLYDVGPGDCVATGMGHHHDFPLDYEPVQAVYLETDLEGQQRHGHLWEYRHGPAQPQPERV